MPLFVNGVAITAVNLNGAPIDILTIDGVTVFSASAPPIWTAANGAGKYGTGTQTASIYMYAAGNIIVNNGSNGMWLPDGKSASNYRVRWVHTSGDSLTSNMAQNTWYVLTSTYYLSLSSPVGLRSGGATITLEEISTGAQLVQPVTITAENVAGGGILL